VSEEKILPWLIPVAGLGWILLIVLGVNMLTVNANYKALETVCKANALVKRTNP
jgi:hypothetical protein